MSNISGGIAAIEVVRKQLEEAQVRSLRLETRCKTISTTLTNMERLSSEVNGTIKYLDEELQNVNKWNDFYDGNLQDAYRSLCMLKETRDKKWKKYEQDARSIRMKIAEKQKEVEERKENHERNIELIWKKIPIFAIREEKRQAILALTNQIKNMGIETLPEGTHDKLKNATHRKMELESELKERKLDLEIWQKKLTEHKAKASSMDEANQALQTELKKVKSIEMALQTKADEAKHDKENHKNKEKAIELECNAGDSGITSMNGDISQNQDAIGNSSVHEQSLDITMFEERASPKKTIGLPRTPSKNEMIRAPGPMHSTPHNSKSKLSEFLRPHNSSHCSVPPNVTPIVNSSLSNSRMLTPINTFQKLDSKSTVGNLDGFPPTAHMKNAISTNYTSEVTPVKSNFINTLPKTPISMQNKSKSMIQPSPTAMTNGLLAPTPEKDSVLNVTPPKQSFTTPSAPSAPTKSSSTSNNSMNVASNQPSPKKLKPSNSFTKVQKPFSPQRSTTQQTNACTIASNLGSSAPKQPNECGDYEDTKFLRIDSTGLNKTPVKENNALPFGSIEGHSDSPMTVVEREKEKMSQGSSPFGYGFPGAPSFGEDGTFGVGQAFGDGSGFGGETGFSGGPGFAGGSDFGGSAFGGSAGFGAASGDSSNFSSGFGGFNF